MSNHYYLLVKTPRGNLSRAMRHIDGVYAQSHSRLNGTDGPLFRGPFKAIVINAGHYLLQVSRYIHRNPVDLKKPLVGDLRNYPWSGFPAYLSQVSIPDWLNRDAVDGELGSRQRCHAYQKYVEGGVDSETGEFYRHKALPSVLGEKAFKEWAFRQARSLDREVDKKGVKHPVTMDEVVDPVSRHYGVPVSQFAVPSVVRA